MTIARNHTGHRIGEHHGRAILSDKTVEAIRADHSKGMGYKTLAKKHGCGISTVRDICTYRTRWAR